MHKFTINFRKTASDRAAEISARAYNHYRRFQPLVEKFYGPIKQIHNKYLSRFTKKYGSNQKGTSFPR